MLATAMMGVPRIAKGWLKDARARLLLGVGISVTLGWLSVRGIEWDLVLDRFETFPIQWFVYSLLLMLAASVVRALRWRALFVERGPGLVRLLLVQNAGIGLNNLAPVRVVSEGAQYALLTMRYGVRGGVAVATIAMERVLDLAVTATLLMAGLTLLPDMGDFLPYVVGAFVVAVLTLAALPAVVWLAGRPLLRRVPVFVSAAHSMMDMARVRSTLAYATAYTLAYWVLIGLCAWVLAHGMGVGLSPFSATLAILGTIYFSTSVPALPAAAGTFEFAVVYVLKAFGVSQALAFSYAVMVHAVLFLPPMVVAVLLFSSIGLGAIRRRDSIRPPNEVGAVLDGRGGESR